MTQHHTDPTMMIANMARYWVRHWAFHEDQEPMIDDVMMAGWVAWLEHEHHPLRQKFEVQNAIQDAICLWLYGVTRGQYPRRWRWRGSLRRARPTPNIDRQAIRRVGIERLWHALKPPHQVGRRSKAQQVLCLLAETGGSRTIPKEDSQRRGVGDRAMLNGKRKIRAMAEAMDLEEVGES